MLVGRDDLLTRVRWVVASACAGSGRSLLLRGDPGSGKSALLDAAREAAEESSARVVRLRGSEDERELPYAGLHSLLRTLAADDVDLVPAQRRALDLALGVEEGGRPASLTVAAATLAVLDARSSDEAVVLIVDDLHWVDGETREVLGFLARRVADNAVGLVLATRPPAALTSIETADVDDLDPAAAVALLGREGASEPVGQRLVDAVGGNPLALLEICRTLDPAQRSGEQPLPEALPLTTAGAAYAELLSRTPPESRLAAGVVAVAGDLPARQLHRVLELAGSAWTDLAAVEREGLIELSGRGVQWRHPLARAAARDGATPDLRRSAHLATAEVLGEDAGDPAALAWHLVHAASGPDPALADRIAEVAVTAASRGAHAAAADAWEAAAALEPDRRRAAVATARAGTERWYADDAERAEPLLAAALPDLVDDDLRWETAATLGQVAGVLHNPVQAFEVRGEAVRIAREQGRRDRLVLALADSFNASTHVGEEAMEAVVAAIAEASDPDDPVQLARRDAVQGFADLIADRTDAGRAHLDAAMARIEHHDLLDRAPDLLQTAVQAVMWSGQTDRLRPQIVSAMERMTSEGDLRVLPATIRGLAWCDYAGGRWQAAAQLADEGLDLARLGRRALDVCDSMCQVGTIEGARGHADEALELAAQARALALDLDAPSRLADAGWAETLALLGTVDLARLADAAPRFAAAVLALSPGQRQPEYFDAAVALALVGRRDEATALHDRLCEGLGDDQRPEVRAGSMLVRLHQEPDSPGLAGEAAALADSLVGDEDYAFGRARLRLAAGAMTRRLGSRSEARRLLRAAEEDFERLGALPWLERTQAELRSSGATLRSAASPQAGLTAAEARVCAAAATGMSTKEIAASLFLSPKTVEFHLGRIFRKLGVRSRAELVSRLARDEH